MLEMLLQLLMLLLLVLHRELLWLVPGKVSHLSGRETVWPFDLGLQFC